MDQFTRDLVTQNLYQAIPFTYEDVYNQIWIEH